MTKVNEIKDVSISYEFTSDLWLTSDFSLPKLNRKKYKEYNARVVEKGELINSTVRNVGRMLRRKIDAVRVCIAFV